jgi:hypothetical protein
MESVENPTLKEVVQKDTQLKIWLVNYVGDKLQPKDGNVTVEMIVDVMAEEFPEYVLALAEENFIRGYEQAAIDFSANKKTKKKK